ncbi:MAG: hypothetical protein VKN72_15735 [Nostocales cyanobacterium 94392]|nr:hypothetical protein [Nostocales cyanobacterium 94392]
MKITQGAFPEVDEKKLVGYIYYCNKFIVDKDIRTLLLYAAFCILEDISYTRKDGQYLRWDYRSGRSKSKNQFNKGNILTFELAISQISTYFNLTEILTEQKLQYKNFIQEVFSLLQPG